MPRVAFLFAAFSLTTAASALAAPGLTAYEGKYPSDAVDGVTFLAHPAVVAGVGATVADRALRKIILSEETVQSPITVKGRVVRADSCEPHNCGDHNWSILVDSRSGATDVCYHDGATMPQDQSRWYLASGKSGMRRGTCFE